MKPVAIVAVGAESALGSGVAAYSVGAVGARPTTRIARDARLVEGGLAKPFAARATSATSGAVDPARDLLERAARGLGDALDTRLPGWRSRRVAVVVGTSSGGLVSFVEALDRRARGEPIPRELARAATYFGPLEGLEDALGVRPELRVQILAACASSGVAIGLGCRLLELGHADLVVAGGYDAVSTFVAAGFESLGATSATTPAPFRAHRDGMALGEAAVLVALAATADAPLGHVRGFGASSDAVHVTAPDREGKGLARAARAALEDAGLDPGAVDLVSAHATATPFNDAAEAKALAAVLGQRACDVVVHPFKAVVGHTLGASSALELASALESMARDVLPGAAGDAPPDPDLGVRLLPLNQNGVARCCLKLSAAFGGANAAIVATRGSDLGAPRARDVSSVELVAVGPVRTAADLAQVSPPTKIPEVQLSRLDALSAASVAAVAALLSGTDPLELERTGVVLGTVTSTLANDEAFAIRLRERGARGVEPRRFPSTSPNLAPGQCSIAFGLLGPSLAVGAGLAAPTEALLVAHDLLAAGDADAIVVVAAEDVDDGVRALFLAAGYPVPEHGAAAALLRRGAPALSRDRLRTLHATAESASGRLGSESPGISTFLEALRRLRAPS